MTGQPRFVTVRELFSGDRRFRVPIYQRAYAWSKVEIETLIRDIASVLDRSAYYIGSLVLHEARDVDAAEPLFDVIDGQQRLTTLFLTLTHPRIRPLLMQLDNPFEITDRLISFEERKRSSLDLAVLARPDVAESAIESLHDDGIRAGAESIANLLGDEDRIQKLFVDQGAARRGGVGKGLAEEVLAYLLDHVQIVLTELPRETDLNHYFEVMNTRGEQLEKHEIVKAHLLGVLGEDTHARAIFATIWDACSDFTQHIQAKFEVKLRSALFGAPDRLPDGAWSVFTPNRASDLSAIFSTSPHPAANIDSDLDSLLKGADIRPVVGPASTDDGDAGRYGAIIDFPNFLLHVLRLHLSGAQTISLDDKKLVAQFERITSSEDVMAFAFRLLRAKFLFDNFMIKPLDDQAGGGDDANWVIHRMHYLKSEARSAKLSPRNAFGDSTRQVLMLQSMYQVTHQRRVYKEFFYEILEYLDTAWANTSEVESAGFLDQLHLMAEKDLGALNLRHTGALDTGTGVPHFALNLLDYKLWWRSSVHGSPDPGLPLVKADDFRFAYRTSIEHFLPVNLADREEQRLVVNDFGNLCLMTRTENSNRSDHTPDWKVEKYGTTDQSLKFHYMAALQKQRKAWDRAEILEQSDVMLRVLFSPLPFGSASSGA